MEVNPDTLLFTQDSIKTTFKQPREDERIDDAVDSLLEGRIEASDFPMLNVVSHEGRLWSLDNRRLWVFKKAEIPSITVNLVSYYQNTRFGNLVECKQNLKNRILQPGFWPRVRGHCREVFHPRVTRGYFSNRIPMQVQQKRVRKLHMVPKFTVVGPTYEDGYEQEWPALGTGFRDAVPNIRHDAPYGQNQAKSNLLTATSRNNGAKEQATVRLISPSCAQNRAKEDPTISPIYATYGHNREKAQPTISLISSFHGQNRAEEHNPTVSPISVTYRQKREQELKQTIASLSCGETRAEEHPAGKQGFATYRHNREKSQPTISLISASHGQNRAEQNNPTFSPIYANYRQKREQKVKQTIASLHSASYGETRAEEHPTGKPGFTSDSCWQDRAKVQDIPQCRLL